MQLATVNWQWCVLDRCELVCDPPASGFASLILALTDVYVWMCRTFRKSGVPVCPLRYLPDSDDLARHQTA